MIQYSKCDNAIVEFIYSFFLIIGKVAIKLLLFDKNDKLITDTSDEFKKITASK